MKHTKKHNKISIGNLISALIFALLLIAMVMFTITYDPSKQFASDFFEDVANSIQWK
ncbi:MAG: hypothetical protein OQL06_08725 [Gammaproteobacteria bacterium]|nr:hypothetical protein [Gammaproteobacteria bacterium]